MSGPPLTAEELAKLPHDDRGPAILAAHWLLTAAATIFLGLRIYCKKSTSRKLWWDDWILIAAWITILITDGLTTALVLEFKLGRHSWDLHVDPTNVSKFIILLSSRASFTLTALGWTKTAFAITLLRLTEGLTRSFVWFIIISLNVTTIISGLVPWIQCAPLEKTWNPTVDGTCWAAQVGTKVWIGMGAYSALMDFVLAVLPWTFLYGLALRSKEKFGILIAMSMGVIAGGVAIAKCAKLPQLGSGDSFNEVELYIWDVTESCVTMMAACIPTLRVLLQTKTGTSTKESSSSSGSSSRQRQRYNMSSITPTSRPSATVHQHHKYPPATAGSELRRFSTVIAAPDDETPTPLTPNDNHATASSSHLYNRHGGVLFEGVVVEATDLERDTDRLGVRGIDGDNYDFGSSPRVLRGQSQQQRYGSSSSTVEGTAGAAYFDLRPQRSGSSQDAVLGPSSVGNGAGNGNGMQTRFDYPSSSTN
ncbi:hypothetical protein B0H66DRAFT_546762 [Apodospora peruviana]|uniref:Rhodopsin domain-containing protein n=1 Tax=Apodospora peruviana TaxID=516989 RepID=A0AAE0MGC4_9PEZI|nr:hypothetical protein B0H66DRAFT_546762 [Apodospora peruviana]